eukprot:5526994-Pyramimonas_sp.AAC.1
MRRRRRQDKTRNPRIQRVQHNCKHTLQHAYSAQESKWLDLGGLQWRTACPPCRWRTLWPKPRPGGADRSRGAWHCLPILQGEARNSD